MKTTCLFILTIAVCYASPMAKRSKRQAYSLPDGADIIVGAIKTTFHCPSDGFYADVDNNCQIFHICHSTAGEMAQFSFMCGNQTMFNQFSLTCAMPEDSIPCSDSPSFFYTNARIWSDDPKQYFLDDADMEKAIPLIPSMYRGGAGHAPSNAISSPGRGRGR